MKLLEERIRKDGTVKAGNVLKVDSFLNHQTLICSMKWEKSGRICLQTVRLRRF